MTAIKAQCLTCRHGYTCKLGEQQQLHACTPVNQQIRLTEDHTLAPNFTDATPTSYCDLVVALLCLKCGESYHTRVNPDGSVKPIPHRLCMPTPFSVTHRIYDQELRQDRE